MKPLRPFPLPIHVGTDICQISRIHAILSGHQRLRFIDRILTSDEPSRRDSRLQATLHLNHSAPARTSKATRDNNGGVEDSEALLWKAATFMAGRFAAKEAVIKAHPHLHLTFHDISIERLEQEGSRLGSGPPVARIKITADADHDQSALLSISHDGDYATAVCIGAAYDADKWK
ncbi:hypothetical protein B0I35DRAFT_7248 [Stachybotrys elegans]|uniref:4'-phosphopantetheinyl transferase domain-containing protein n=1 Tax=Stachybotrys elegans TaxID=80388 RepID=A0A8K0WX28_9HYPO|nr:hypothetical protein B0I35DRAFT_7248 [Stachybotrys elegans]